MPLIIPYTFVAGTKAKAAEVNADFQAVATEVNAQGNSLTTAQANITNLQNNKADINGNSSNRFSVAVPINSYDAVNKIYLTDLTKYLLVGLQLRKDDDDYIGCTKGATYDKTYSKILKFDADVSKQNTNQSANSTYYVYIEGSADGTTTDLLISLSSNNPALDSGFTLYRYLGYYKTDDDGNISKVYSAAPVSGANVFNNVIIAKYTSGTSGYRVWADGWCEQWGRVTSTARPYTVTLLKEYKNTNYNVYTSSFYTDNSNRTPEDNQEPMIKLYGTTVKKFTFMYDAEGFNKIMWKTEGYI